MNRRWSVAFFLPALLVVTAAPMLAQNGVIQGNVLDGTGSAIVGAKVTATDESKGLIAREVQSGADGEFQLLQLQRGVYTVKVETVGFKALQRTGLVLDPNQIMNVGALTMQIGDVTESVTVEAEVPLVETATAQKSFVIDSKQVTELSLNGRDFQSLMKTVPGVVSNDTSDFRLAFNNTDAFNVNGLRGSMNNFFLDGSINTDVGANDGQYTQVSMDAIGEFKVQTSVFSAEHGRNPGILLSATTKGGTNEYHGTLYEFVRNDRFDARTPFDTTGRKTKLRFNQFGFNLGGPVPFGGEQKRLFFFVNYEGTRASRPTGGTFVDVPHGDLLNGDFARMIQNVPISTAPQFSVGTVFQPGTITRNDAGNITGGVPYPNNVVPRAAWSANAPAFLNLLNRADRAAASPTPNQPWLLRVPFQDTYRFHKNQWVVRADYNISQNANFFFRWVDDSQNETQQNGIFGSTPYPVFPMYRAKPGSSWSWNLVNVISPSTTNEFIFAYNHLTQVVDVAPGTEPNTYEFDALGFKYQPLFPNANTRDKFPRFNCAVGSCNFGGFPANWESEGKTYAWTNNFTKIAGSHAFKIGGIFNMNDNGQQPAWNDAGNFDFSPNRENPNDTSNGLANLLLGHFTSHQQANGKFFGDFRFFGLEWYAQDSWKVNSQLTLEFGVRYAFLGPTYTRGDLLQYYFDPTRFDPTRAPQLDLCTSCLRRGSLVPGTGDPLNGLIKEGDGIPLGYSKHRKNNWSPRFGFAFDPTGSGRTSIRGGFGSFFERIRQNQMNFDGLGNPPVLSTPTIYGLNVDNVSPALIAGGTLFPPNLVAWEKDGFIPTIYSWSLGIQHQLPGNTAIDVAYVGNTTRHLQERKNINALPLGTTVNTPILSQVNNVANAARPYRGYQNINFTDFASNSNYHALQARLSRRFAQSLTFNFNYTWSKVLAQTEVDGDVLGYHLDRQREWGPADFDRTQVFTFDYVYELPNLGTRAFNNAFGRKLLDGWQISGITRFWDGFPLTVGSNGSPGTIADTGTRADYLGGDTEPGIKSRLEYFNPLVFGRPVDGSLGNTGKGILRGPGINNWDISVFKNTYIGERINAQFRFEMFNFFNHTQWAGISTNINVPNPGQAVTQTTRGNTGSVTSTRDPRTIQLGLKVYF